MWSSVIPSCQQQSKYSSRSVTPLQGEPHHLQAFQPSRAVTALLCREIFMLDKATTPFLFNSKEKREKIIDGHVILPKVTWDPDLFFILRKPLLLSSCRALFSTKTNSTKNFSHHCTLITFPSVPPRNPNSLLF